MKTKLHHMFRSMLSLSLGVLVGILMSYLFYRLSLPIKPFVYVAF
ncbi:MAG TPA: hypothetical protein VIT23_06485 [Terrimicrobiaceae bacterium]